MMEDWHPAFLFGVDTTGGLCIKATKLFLRENGQDSISRSNVNIDVQDLAAFQDFQEASACVIAPLLP